VLAVEGSLARARLARLRTRDLTGVEIACAPFQRLAPNRNFDLIFCIGVLEYSELFVEAGDPFDQVLKLLASWLNPGGTLVVAIENQFGLKYFNGLREDHLGVPFEGLEGYHGSPAGPRTFGRGELAGMLATHFPHVEFLYPFPDYKIPSSVVRHEFLAGNEAAEIAMRAPSRDYHSPSRGLWDESLVTMELGRNGMLPCLANSFLALASTTSEASYEFPQQAILFSDDRRPELRTVTTVCDDGEGRLRVRKSLAGGMASVVVGPLRLHAYDSDWQSGQSLESILLARCRRIGSDLEEIFGVCRDWVQALREQCVISDLGPMLPGRLLDATWSNTFFGGRELRFIDQEWEWHEALPLNVVVIRAIYVFLCHAEERRQLHPSLADRNARRLISRIGACIGLQLTAGDFERFVHVQAEVHGRVRGADRARTATMLRWFLVDRRLLSFVMRVKESVLSVAARVGRLLRGIRACSLN
jgi:SAM-dependent methyltransferase